MHRILSIAFIYSLLVGFPAIANAKTTYNCVTTDYSGAKHGNRNYDEQWASGWVPRSFELKLGQNNTLIPTGLPGDVTYQKVSKDVIKFKLKARASRGAPATLVGSLDLKSYDFKVKITFSNYDDSGYIKGSCKPLDVTVLTSNNSISTSSNSIPKWITDLTDTDLCNYAKFAHFHIHVKEAQRRGLTCGVNEGASTQAASSSSASSQSSSQLNLDYLADASICNLATIKTGLSRNWNSSAVYVQEAKNRGLTCGVIEASSNQAASSSPSTQSSASTSSELLAAQQEAEALKQRLAELEAQQSQPQQATSADTQIPLITITRADTDDKQGIVVGRVSDNVGVAEVTVDGNVVPLMSNGSFEYSTYVPATGKMVEVQVTDLAGLSSSQTVTLERNVNLATASISFDELNPIAKPAKRNSNALALIIGVSDYENTPAKAIFADTDAIVFHDYASEKLGIPENRIKTLVNDGADIREFLLSTQNWLSRSVKQDQTDVYVFFAGHGLASDDGQNMYLLPYDGSPELLDRTAILRDELFSDIASANPRSVTVFLDTCYSGSTRGSEMLIAARPILLKAKESVVPEGFTVFTAAAGDETAKPLEEAKHGMFSYFLMKGMEGDADTNGDKQITAGELHAYVKSNVVQQSSGTQTPELQGDADRVLVRFQ